MISNDITVHQISNDVNIKKNMTYEKGSNWSQLSNRKSARHCQFCNEKMCIKRLHDFFIS